MDILLSLPIVSYLFSSPLTSWSTSLNLLFFYMTWSTLVLTYSPLQIEVAAATALRIVFWLAPSLIFLAFDTLVPSLAENLKHHGASALPPRESRSLLRVAGLALLNLALETVIEAALSLGLSMFLGAPVLRTATTLPLPWQMFKHIALLLTAREVLTYYIHRYALHRQPAPTEPNPAGNRLVRWHTQSPAHARRAPPFSLLLRADHPVPYLLHRFLPTYLPSVALAALTPEGLHALTYLLFVALTTLEETLATSGYSIVPGIIMGGMARRTAMHYAAGNKRGGDFGNWGVLDWVHGTSLGRDVMDDLQAEVGKHGPGAGGCRGGLVFADTDPKSAPEP
ncbi:hypothetical protein N656DRAFT_838947 [Canariomyces notabilis]|uniref:Fatty acid hydroxylase domain-containing protein n=1 Tax=Canariomyces notabilis TaxID=2074819 RepID=A0AAN6QNR2_9PEZI|nr:hypothetical protein N656DRAFT_838947 [Canariomyces arenarius]